MCEDRWYETHAEDRAWIMRWGDHIDYYMYTYLLIHIYTGTKSVLLQAWAHVHPGSSSDLPQPQSPKLQNVFSLFLSFWEHGQGSRRGGTSSSIANKLVNNAATRRASLAEQLGVHCQGLHRLEAPFATEGSHALERGNNFFR